MSSGNGAAPRILAYAPRDGEAAEYRRLIIERRPQANVVAAATPEAFQSHIAEAEIVMGWMFPPDAFVAAPRLRWVHKVSAGVEDVVYGQPLHSSVALTRSHGAAIAPRMVEYVLGAIYSHAQRFERAGEQQRAHVWRKYTPDLASARTVGIAGLGDIGRTIAAALHRSGFRVIGWRRTRLDVEGVAQVYAGAAELDAFVAACDFLVIVLPATKETNKVFDASTLSALKPDAYLINIARGSIVDETALIRVLRERRIAGAALDVFEQEPLSADSPLWDLPNVRLTPHVSGPVIAADVVGCFMENLERYEQGRPLERTIDTTRGY